MGIEELEKILINFNNNLDHCPKSIKTVISLLEEYKIKQSKELKEKVSNGLRKAEADLIELHYSNKSYFKEKGFDELLSSLKIQVSEFEKEENIVGPVNYLLLLLRLGNVKLSELREEDIYDYATRHVIRQESGSYSGFTISGVLHEKLIRKDVADLRKILSSEIFRNVYIGLIGKVQKLTSKDDKYFRSYVVEKWRKLRKEYDTSKLKVPLVEYVGWLLKRKNGEFDGEKIILYVLEEITLIHEMVHYCQFSRNPYELKSIIYMNNEEYEAKRIREIEAYFVSHKVIGKPISMKEAERLAKASMHEE